MSTNTTLFIKLSVLGVIIFNSWHCFAQNVRITVAVKSANNQYHVIPLREKGVVIFYENNAKSPGARTERWTFTKFDTTFSEEWTIEYPLINNLNYISKFEDELFVYILFTTDKEFQIVKLDQETGEIFINKGRLPKQHVDIHHFAVMNDNAFIGGSISPPDATVFYRSCIGFACFPLLFIPNFLPEKTAYIAHASLQSKLNKQVLLELKGKSEVVNFGTDTANGRLNAMIKNQNGKNSDLFIQELKYSGAKALATPVKPFTDQYQLIDGKINFVNANTKIVTGTFANKGYTGAQGLYLAQLNNGKQEFIRYQSFTNFKNFFAYLPPKEQQKLQKKISKQKDKGKDLELSYQMLVHEPIVSDTNEYIIVTEVYAPQYHTEYRTSWYYGRPIETAFDVFDGWRYSHAIIAGLDRKGELLWDNSILIQDILTFNLNEKVQILHNDKQYIAAYSQRGQIQYKYLSRDTTQTEKMSTQVETNNDYEKVKEEYNSDVAYWYGNYFIAYGSQKVKNLDSEYTKSSGTVIYFNKIELKPKDPN